MYINNITKRNRQERCRSTMCSLFVLLLIACVAHIDSFDKPCKYWCKTGDHRYYCCPSGKSESWSEWHSFLHPWFWVGFGAPYVPPSHKHWPEIHAIKSKPKKHCPPLRAHCPRSNDWYDPPSFCDNDDDCVAWEKCCYDVCLEHKTCKPAE